MGMFDSVVCKCRNKDCEAEIEFQSKAGICDLNRYSIDEVPLSVAEDIDGQTEVCKKCQFETTIYLPLSIPKFLQMKVR